MVLSILASVLLSDVQCFPFTESFIALFLFQELAYQKMKPGALCFLLIS